MKPQKLSLTPLTTAIALFIILIAYSSVAGAAQVTLAWDTNNPAPDGYRVYRRAEGGSYNYSSPSWTGAATTATLANLADNTTYYCVVRAYVGSQESGNSNEVKISPQTSSTSSSGTTSSSTTTVTLDNGSSRTSATGSWPVSGGTSPYGANSLYSKESGARYTFAPQSSGRCQVRLWWTDYSSRCGNVPVYIYDGSSRIDTVYVDQRQNGGRWNTLGEYTFSGSPRVVIAASGSSCSTCADAAQFAYTTTASGTTSSTTSTSTSTTNTSSSSTTSNTSGSTSSSTSGTTSGSTSTTSNNSAVIVLDDGKTGTTASGSWKVSGGTNPYGSQSLYSKDTSGRYTFSSELSGRYEVSLWWTEYSSRCGSVPVYIYDDNDLLKTIYVDQRENGGLWNVLGSFEFSGKARVVVASRDSSCSTCADAAEFSLDIDDDDSLRVIDDGERGTLEVGKWSVSGGTGAYGSQSLYSKDTSGKYSYSAQLSGNYGVSLWWSAYSSRCGSVPVNVYNGSTKVGTVYVNQRQNGGKWNSLGRYNFTGSARVEVVSRDSSCSTCADAVQYVK